MKIKITFQIYLIVVTIYEEWNIVNFVRNNSRQRVDSWTFVFKIVDRNRIKIPKDKTENSEKCYIYKFHSETWQCVEEIGTK